MDGCCNIKLICLIHFLKSCSSMCSYIRITCCFSRIFKLGCVKCVIMLSRMSVSRVYIEHLGKPLGCRRIDSDTGRRPNQHGKARQLYTNQVFHSVILDLWWCSFDPWRQFWLRGQIRGGKWKAPWYLRALWTCILTVTLRKHLLESLLLFCTAGIHYVEETSPIW